VLLKKIEIQGFKSFVDPTELSFEPGISAIVGPNGCGKSNVSDSIRWVLGEQSAKALRGAKMEDVIFNGTESRKPSGMAEVSLTIGNEDHALATDFSEVTVTRRSYRSGESEYLLNRAPCRLKDIHAIFADTGVGTDGYSLLEQGKMDLILSSKPADRRAVFEEAAGITKYKSQRDEALRKLESTEQNLLRLNDIISEVRRQINSLERQARKAEKYNTMKVELDALESRLLLDDYRQTGQRLEELAREIQSARDQASGLEASVREREGEASQVHLSLVQDEESLSAAQGRVHAVETEMAQKEGDIQVFRARIGGHQEMAARAGAESAEQLQKAEAAQAGWLHSQAEADRVQGELSALEKDLAADEAALQAAAAERGRQGEQAQKLQQGLIDAINQRALLRGESDTLKGKLVLLDQRAAQVRQELLAAQESLQHAIDRLEEAMRLSGGKQEELKSIEGSLGGLYQRRQVLEEAASRLDETISTTGMTLSSLRSRLSVLDELSRALTGYEAGPRALLMARQEGQFGGLDSLAHRVRTRPEFEQAVELSLGHRLQALIAGSVDEARGALAWLKQKNQGRASVLLPALAGAPAQEFTPELLQRPGVLGVLADFLEADPQLRPATRWLAGHLLLVQDLDAALALREALPLWAEAVTLEGEMVSAAGAITGGASDSPERGLIGREREMDELKRKVAELQAQADQARADRERVRAEMTHLVEDIQHASSAMQGVQIAVAQLEQEQQQKRQDQDRLNQESAAKQQAIMDLDRETTEARLRTEELERRLLEMDQQETRLKDEYNQAMDVVDRLRGEEGAIAARLSQCRVAQAGLKERHDAQSAELKRLEGEDASLRAAAASLQAEKARHEQEAQRLHADIGSLERHIIELNERKQSAHQDSVKVSETRGEHQRQAGLLEEELKSLRHQFSGLSQALHGQEMQHQELSLKVGGLRDTLTHTFHVDLEASAQAELPPVDLPADPQGRVDELKARIADLGVVNPAAAEEYRELEQRHTTLGGQIDDLQKAKADLHKVIIKINQTTRERFIQTFEQVQANFKEVFSQLFRGGEAKLTLQDEGDLLEAGIDIIARPPGKRQQTVSLLSGGERALTAIALLFALFRLKPSPFCVLDEIDAPLDDANISRFANMLGDYKGKTQFVVITHSKLTMEKADVLYGITMEESGVSKVISARFKDEAPALA
jgi:chromosome segregation protein